MVAVVQFITSLRISNIAVVGPIRFSPRSLAERGEICADDGANSDDDDDGCDCDSTSRWASSAPNNVVYLSSCVSSILLRFIFVPY